MRGDADDGSAEAALSAWAMSWDSARRRNVNDSLYVGCFPKIRRCIPRVLSALGLQMDSETAMAETFTKRSWA